MRTYKITYWTGLSDTIGAKSLLDAYTKFGYSVNSDESYMWDNEDGTATVTNEYGDLCATIEAVSTHLHTYKCQAHAIICAVENLRDSDNPKWTLDTHGDKVREIGLAYLATDSVSCIC